MRNRNKITAKDIDRADEFFRKPPEHVNVSKLVENALQRSDDKTWASHNEMVAILDVGGEKVRVWNETAGSGNTVRLVQFQNAMFVHACGGKEDVCFKKNARKLFNFV